ncbi:hypothetical protein RP75_06950 [Agrobacterium arsenijevicii]|uniref:Uncharacterized protein n=1 Tax=Agrobacterium arsenijevicii TaxID=1585697 RepID=A0ABR5DA51_9HYPH|nr:hypothetical protein RP75_06950 [Agrobacterium arsenijevicii]
MPERPDAKRTDFSLSVKNRASAFKILPGKSSATGNYFINYRICRKIVRLCARILPQVFI